MVKIDVSAEESRQIKKNAIHGGFSVIDLPSVEGQPFTWYTDPRSGREMYLPCDATNQRTYLMKGYRIGHPAGCAHETADELATTSNQPPTAVPLSNALPTNIQDIVNTAVQAALKAAGVEVPEPPVEPKQLELF